MDRPKKVKWKLDFEAQHIQLSKAARNKLTKPRFMAKLKEDLVAFDHFKKKEALRAKERTRRKKGTITEQEQVRIREQSKKRQKVYRPGRLD